MSAEEVVALHSGASYTVAAVGFSPGFPYLSVCRSASICPAARRRGSRCLRDRWPWPADRRGSIHLRRPAAGMCWDGRHCVCLIRCQPGRPCCDPATGCGSCPWKSSEPAEGEISSVAEPAGHRWIEVIQPGALTTVQDLGRPGYESSGVSPGGAVDRQALRVANLLVGNDEGAAVLEICMQRPGAQIPRGNGGRRWSGATGRPQRVAAGETVDFSKLTGGVRACLAVAGGMRVPEILGSMPLTCAPDSAASTGGRCGRVTVEFRRSGTGTPRRRLACRPAGRKFRIELRFLPGVQQHWFSEEARRRFRRESISSRRGPTGWARGCGPELKLAEPREMVSQPVVRLGASAAGRPAHRSAGRAPDHRRLPADRACDLRGPAETRARLARNAGAFPRSHVGRGAGSAAVRNWISGGCRPAWSC